MKFYDILLTIGNMCKLGPAKRHNKTSDGFLPSDEDLKNAKKYSRVMIFGVDGAGDYFNKCEVPNFDRIFGHGSRSFTALSQFPTISAQNWGSVLHGVTYQTHKVTNEIAAAMNFVNKDLPSVYRVCAEARPGTVSASIVNWYPINKGIVENKVPGLYKINAGEIYKGPSDDEAIDRTACEQIIEFIQDKDPVIMYTHLDGPDHGGHSYGYGTPEYITAVQHADELVGRIYDAYCEKGWKDDTLFILVTDHGHVCKKRKDGTTYGGHGGWTDSEKYVTLAVAGGLGDVIDGMMGQASTMDVASIALYGLGIKQPAVYESRVPKNVFTTLK